jgi:hypothetical protein
LYKKKFDNLDPDSGAEYNADPDPKHCMFGSGPSGCDLSYESGSEIRTFLTETYVAFKDLLDLSNKR